MPIFAGCYAQHTGGRTGKHHAALVAGLADDSLNPVIGAELSLAAAPEAHRAVLEPGAFGKIVLKS